MVPLAKKLQGCISRVCCNFTSFVDGYVVRPTKRLDRERVHEGEDAKEDEVIVLHVYVPPWVVPTDRSSAEIEEPGPQLHINEKFLGVMRFPNL